MFRRKEEGLFDTDVLERTDEIESINIITPAANESSANQEKSSSSQSAAPYPTTPAAQQPASSSHAPKPSAAPQQSPTTPSFRSTTTQAPQMTSIPEITRPRPTDSKPASTPASAPSSHSGSKNGARVLTVGNDILLKGEIATCDRLVIEGKVEATLNDVHTVELADCGSFKGNANVVDAQISGSFQGDLVCTGRLVIHASGTVSGKITYGEIEIERGGEISGEIKTVSSSKLQNSTKAARKEAA